MSEEEEKLKQTANLFKRMSKKIKLSTLIKKAKIAYDNYDYTQGLEDLQEALKLDDKNSVVLRGIGCVKQSEEKYDEAIKYYKKALETSTNKEIEYTLIGTAYYMQDKLDEAVENFNYAIDANDDYTKAYECRNQAMLENHVKILDLQELLIKNNPFSN